MKDRGAIIATGVTGTIVAAMFGIFIIGGGGTSDGNTTPQGGEVVSEQPIHWHPNIEIQIKGEKQVIPANISGLVHTHDTSGQLHWEIGGTVYKEQVQLKAFFSSWGKTFNSQQLLDKKNGSEGTVKMTVNGQVNTEYDNYIVKDADKILLSYE